MAAKKTARKKSSKTRVPTPDDVFALAHGGQWVALRVLKKIHRTCCVMLTEYLGDTPPTLVIPGFVVCNATRGTTRRCHAVPRRLA